MHTRLSTAIVAGTVAIAGLIGAPVRAQEQPAPPLVQQLNNGNWLPVCPENPYQLKFTAAMITLER